MMAFLLYIFSVVFIGFSDPCDDLMTQMGA
jgi:hypothetical protein